MGYSRAALFFVLKGRIMFYGCETAPEEVKKLYNDLKKCWCAETCAPRMRGGWSEENPALGQCSVTAFLAQDIFGGEVWGVPLGDGNCHCFNVVSGAEFDLTSEQFPAGSVDYSDRTLQSRGEHFAKAEKYERYLLLRARLVESRANN